MKGLRCLLIFILLGGKLFAQDLTGIWRGYFITESGDQYKFELQLGQDKSNRITGVSYSYLSTIFYGKAALSGTMNRLASTALIQELKTLEVRMSGASVACIMKCLFNYAKSGREEFLEGTFSSMYEQSENGVKRGGDCGNGKIYLRKVPTSDFYVEPFLREKLAEKKPTVPLPTPAKPVTKAPVKHLTKPPVKKLTTQKKVAPKNNPVVKNKLPQKTATPPIAKALPPKINVEKKPIETPIVTQEAPKKEPSVSIINLPPVLKNRSNEVIQTINLKSEEVTIKIYDNGEIDDDTVSVYLDNTLILANKRLTTSPLTYTFTITKDQPEHTITMVAENLGRIPPNTSLMLVYNGDNRYEVRISTNEQKNAVIRFRYKQDE